MRASASTASLRACRRGGHVGERRRARSASSGLRSRAHCAGRDRAPPLGGAATPMARSRAPRQATSFRCPPRPSGREAPRRSTECRPQHASCRASQRNLADCEDVRAEPCEVRAGSSSTGPFQSTPSASHPAERATAGALSGTPADCTSQRPLSVRCERSTTPPPKRNTRFFPSAVADSSTRPSSRSASIAACARGCGVATPTRSPTSAWSARAAR